MSYSPVPPGHLSGYWLPFSICNVTAWDLIFGVDDLYNSSNLKGFVGSTNASTFGQSGTVTPSNKNARELKSGIKKLPVLCFTDPVKLSPFGTIFDKHKPFMHNNCFVFLELFQTTGPRIGGAAPDVQLSPQSLNLGGQWSDNPFSPTTLRSLPIVQLQRPEYPTFKLTGVTKTTYPISGWVCCHQERARFSWQSSLVSHNSPCLLKKRFMKRRTVTATEHVNAAFGLTTDNVLTNFHVDGFKISLTTICEYPIS